MGSGRHILKGEVFDFPSSDEDGAMEGLVCGSSGRMFRHISAGAILLEGSEIRDVGAFSTVSAKYPGTGVTDYSGYILIPGFVDAHAHYPQCELIASYGETLLAWLEKYTFPAEKKFCDRDYADQIAEFFIRELLRNGTTTAFVFAASFRESVEALFEAAEKQGMLVAGGQVLMDRNGPQSLLGSSESLRVESEQLIKKWHGKGRIKYALTPRFAPTCTPELLDIVGQLKSEYQDLYIQTHISENKDEVRWVQDLFPECSGYLDVYQKYGLLTDRSVFAHCIYLSKEEWQSLSDHNSALVHCPSSNLFLGSGLFSIKDAHRFGSRIALGTDVGGGTSFSMLQTVQDAYKVSALNQHSLSAEEAFYHLTLGAAKTLSLDQKIGNFDRGKEADIVVLDYKCTPVLDLRCKAADNILDRLFALMMLGDDRAVKSTYVAGRRVWDRSQCN